MADDCNVRIFDVVVNILPVDMVNNVLTFVPLFKVILLEFEITNVLNVVELPPPIDCALVPFNVNGYEVKISRSFHRYQAEYLLI